MGTIKKYNRKRIGEVFTSSEGYSLEVVDGGSKNNYCTVRVDNKYDVEVRCSQLVLGKVKNIYHQSVFGVGFIGVGVHKAYIQGKPTKQYTIWVNMLRRIYSIRSLKKRPTYKSATVCEEWHNFQNFAKWFELHYIDGYDLDKDLLSDIENKIYSPNTCVFVPRALNTFLATGRETNTSGVTGASQSRGNKWEARISDNEGKINYLGTFINKKDAAAAYQTQRKIYAKQWQEKMQRILPQHAIERIA